MMTITEYINIAKREYNFYNCLNKLSFKESNN